MTHKEGLDAADVVIENERLKTSLMILNQKIRTQEIEDNLIREKDAIINKLKNENVAL